MDVKKLILNKARKRGWVKSSEIVKQTGFSRVYLNRFFQELVRENLLLLAGKANRARYVLAGRKFGKPKAISKILKIQDLHEDQVLEEIKRETSIFEKLSRNLARTLAYGFTEMLNNAIEHSRSKAVKIDFVRQPRVISFMIRDYGVGVFRNVQKKFRLKGEVEAINHLLKGKQTTAPQAHSGEGIFFTSKASDVFMIDSFGKRLLVDNINQDVFVKNIKSLKGSRVSFTISPRSRKTLSDIFAEFAGKGFEFSKTKVLVRLGLIDDLFLSRSQARRIIFGLDKFKHIILDFAGVDGIGQSFADEIFRIWQSQHPGIRLVVQNANDNVSFMIKRAK